MSRSFAFAEFQVMPSHLPHVRKRLGRRYILTVETTLNNNNCRLTYCYGGYQRHLAMMSVWCTDYDDLLMIMRQKIKQRIRHGYSLVAVSPDFPLYDWIRDQGYLSSSATHFKTTAFQLFLPYFSLQ